MTDRPTRCRTWQALQSLRTVLGRASLAWRFLAIAVFACFVAATMPRLMEPIEGLHPWMPALISWLMTGVAALAVVLAVWLFWAEGSQFE